MNSVLDSLGIMCPMDTNCICGSNYLADDDDTNHYITMPMAGINKDSISIESQDSKRIHIAYQEGNKNCSRTFVLPEPIDIKNSEAELRNGMLSLTLPKSKPTRNTIAIK